MQKTTGTRRRRKTLRKLKLSVLVVLFAAVLMRIARHRPSTAMHMQKVGTLGFPTVQTDCQNSTVAPSYPPSTSGNLVLGKTILPFFGPTSDP